MIVIGPAQSKPVLARLLRLRRAVPAHPELALCGKPQIARQVASEVPDRIVDQPVRRLKPTLVVLEVPWACPESF